MRNTQYRLPVILLEIYRYSGAYVAKMMFVLTARSPLQLPARGMSRLQLWFSSSFLVCIGSLGYRSFAVL